MELTLWTYEGPPHVGAMRIASSMKDIHYVLHAPQGDTYADLLFTMIERRGQRPPVTYTTFQARDLGGDTAELVKKNIKDEQLNEIDRLMKIVNLTQKVDSKAGSLSHGQKQWLEIAMLVGQKPDLMLVDEPVAGLTDEETDLTADLLKSLSGENTVVVIDHDMEFIRRLDSNVSVLNQGTVLCEGTMETIQKDKKVIDVYLGRPED